MWSTQVPRLFNRSIFGFTASRGGKSVFVCVCVCVCVRVTFFLNVDDVAVCCECIHL